MGLVLVLPQGLDDPAFEPAQLGETLLGHADEIGGIPEDAVEDETQAVDAAMVLEQDLDLHPSQLEFVPRLDGMALQRGLEIGRRALVLGEQVLEPAPDVVERRRRAVDRDPLAVRPVETAQLVHSSDVVGMRVGEQDRVDARVAGRQQLVADVRPGVDQEVEPVLLDENGAALAPVLRIVGIAPAPAGMAERGNPDRGARAEHGDPHDAPCSMRWNSRRVLSAVRRAISAASTPLTSASRARVCTTNPGSLRLTLRIGSGVR